MTVKLETSLASAASTINAKAQIQLNISMGVSPTPLTLQFSGYELWDFGSCFENSLKLFP